MTIDNKSLKYLNESLNVSRETLGRLEIFVRLTEEWQKAINLISPSTVKDIWWRHIVDSAQLYPLIAPYVRSIVDLGSGGGFPALVLAAMSETERTVTLIESDRRKGIFLKEAARSMGLTNVTVITSRIEAAPPQYADLVTARALASLSQLVEWAKPHGSSFLFPKGEHFQDEIAALPANTYKVAIHSSVTDDKARIVALQSL